MYCAFQYRGSIEDLALRKASNGHCSGHSDFSFSVFSFRMAGSSTISHCGESGLLTWYWMSLPVKSNGPQRVMMTMIAPPGIRRCNGPV